MKMNVSDSIGQLSPRAFTEATEVGTQMKDQAKFLVPISDLADSRLNLRDKIIDGEVADRAQADASVRKLLDWFNHADRL